MSPVRSANNCSSATRRTAASCKKWPTIRAGSALGSSITASWPSASAVVGDSDLDEPGEVVGRIVEQLEEDGPQRRVREHLWRDVGGHGLWPVQAQQQHAAVCVIDNANNLRRRFVFAWPV